MAHKLAYEWKNIYRTLSNNNNMSQETHGIVKIGEFQKVCQRSGIEFDKKELVKMVNNFGTKMASTIERSLDR